MHRTETKKNFLINNEGSWEKNSKENPMTPEGRQ